MNTTSLKQQIADMLKEEVLEVAKARVTRRGILVTMDDDSTFLIQVERLDDEDEEDLENQDEDDDEQDDDDDDDDDKDDD